MKTAFLTESQFQGKVPHNHLNMRTEMAWQAALQSDHFNIHNFSQVKDYDVVFIIFPKATAKLNAVGIEMTTPGADKDIGIYSAPIVETLKKNNVKICAVQEGPAWFFNEYDLTNQFNFYNQLSECDIIFAHNEYDTHFYKGLFPRTKIACIPTLMIINNDTCPNHWVPENKAVISGNFCRWYGGFQSYLVASEFQCPIFVPASHCKRPGEEQVPNLTHMPWVHWTQWMEQLSHFKYAVSMMPTIAAGTFSANCGYYGIPCIGNEKVDTQMEFFPDLSVDVHDVYEARHLAIMLREDKIFYEHCSNHAKVKFKHSIHGNPELWLEHMGSVLNTEIEVNTHSREIYKKVTVVFTSCGRFDLLAKTLGSFLKYNDYPIEKYIVIDNSTLPNAEAELNNLFQGLKATILINKENIGQVSSIDKAYSKVTSEYLFHCEDDWEFFDYNFIEKSISVLEYDKNLVNVSIRVRFDGERGSLHPVSDEKHTTNGTVYHEYIPNYLGVWHGFSWNPGLRRLSDYTAIKPYKKYGEESGVGLAYYNMGRRSACLSKFYCKHIGQNSTTEKRNE